jgi:hypothetical protein
MLRRERWPGLGRRGGLNGPRSVLLTRRGKGLLRGGLIVGFSRRKGRSGRSSLLGFGRADEIRRRRRSRRERRRERRVDIVDIGASRRGEIELGRI